MAHFVTVGPTPSFPMTTSHSYVVTVLAPPSFATDMANELWCLIEGGHNPFYVDALPNTSNHQ